MSKSSEKDQLIKQRLEQKRKDEERMMSILRKVDTKPPKKRKGAGPPRPSKSAHSGTQSMRKGFRYDDE